MERNEGVRVDFLDFGRPAFCCLIPAEQLILQLQRKTEHYLTATAAASAAMAEPSAPSAASLESVNVKSKVEERRLYENRV